MKIHKGDTVQIIAGKDKGKTGKILKIDKINNTVLIEDLNLYKKHKRPKKQGEKGEIISIPRPLKASNVQIFCSSCKKPTRIGIRYDGNVKIRHCKRCLSLL